MGILDDLKMVVDQGGVRLSRSGRTAQLRMHLSELSKQRNELAAELGASLYYATREDEALRLGREMIYDGIAKIDLQIDEIRRQLATSDEVVDRAGSTCPTCGAHLADDARFCSKCGTPIPEQATPVEVAETQRASCCPHCGYPRTEEDLFCLNCGALLDEYHQA